MVKVIEKTGLTERVSKVKEELLTATPHVDIEKIKIHFEMEEETRHRPAVIRPSDSY